MAVEAGGIGARLRAGREKLGLTVLQVAERIHTDPKIVEAIEAENFEVLGAPVYARGHIRHYADLVGESANELTQTYSNLSKVGQPDLTRIVKAPAGPESNKLVAPALVVVAVFAVAGAIWWIAALSKKAPQMSETHVVTDEAPASPDASAAPGGASAAADSAGTPAVGGAPTPAAPPAAMSMQPQPGSNGSSAGGAGPASSGASTGQSRSASNGTNGGSGGGSAQGHASAGSSASAGSTSPGATVGQPRSPSNGANGGTGAGSPRQVASVAAGNSGASGGSAAAHGGAAGAATSPTGVGTSARGGAATSGTPARAPTAVQPTRIPPPTPPAASTATPSAPTRVASAAPARSPAAGAAVAPAPAPEPVAAPHAKAQSSVTLRYSADSWTEVYDASGARLFYDVGAANSVKTVVGTPPLRVVLGNASGVSVEYNGHSKPIAKLSRPDGSVQFSITRSGEVVRAKAVADGG